MENKKERKVSLILVLAIIAIIGIPVISIIESGIANKELKQQYAYLTEAVESQNQQNAEIENKLREENEDKNLEDIARNEFDYIHDGERVYADSANK